MHRGKPATLEAYKGSTKGGTAWMEAWLSWVPAPAPRVAPGLVGGYPTPVNVQPELVMALVGMALSCRGR